MLKIIVYSNLINSTPRNKELKKRTYQYVDGKNGDVIEYRRPITSGLKNQL